MTLMKVARKTITAVFGTMALQLIEAFQYSVTYSMKQTNSFFDCCNAFIDFIVCDCSLSHHLNLCVMTSEIKKCVCMCVCVFPGSFREMGAFYFEIE